MPAICALVVDLDGVISPVHGHTEWGDDVVAGWLFGDVLVSPAMCRAVDELVARRRLVGVWLTDWSAQMRDQLSIRPAGEWDDLDRAEFEARRTTELVDSSWWRAQALMEWLDAHPQVTTLAWVDDHLDRLADEDSDRTRRDAVHDAFSRHGVTAELISPSTAVG